MEKKTICALGFFDGVHLGHQTLLRACRVLAEQYGCGAGAVTFTTHPDSIVSGSNPPLLNTAEDRRSLLSGCGMEAIAELSFDKKRMQTPWSEFLSELVDANAAGFVCGSDFRFGAGGAGTAEKLKAFCEERHLPCAVVPQQTLEGIRVSSTHIRALIEQGEMEKATAFLGHPHILSGEVAAGRQLGRTIGIPTANLQLPEGVLCPRFGVYACKATADGKTYTAVTNVGTRPTVAGNGITVESWLQDFEGDLYGKKLQLQFYKFLRPEEKFPSLEALQGEIRKNAREVRQYFREKV